MHRYLALSLVSALLLLSGCDSGDDGDGEGNGGLALGTITARIDGAAFSSAFAIARPCALCPLVGADGIEVAGVAQDGTGVGFVLLSFDGAGTYPLGAGESEGVVDLEDGSSFATDLGGSGTVVVTRSTAQAIEGTFSFTAGDGAGGTVRVTEGRFNVPFSGL